MNSQPNHSEQADERSWIGESIGRSDRYKISELLRSESRFQSYLAEDQQLGRQVELCIYEKEHKSAASAQISILASLQHPSVRPVLDAFVHEDLAVHVLTELDGYNLADLLDGETALEAKELLNIAPQILDVLITLHDQGFLHLGLCPAHLNISTTWNSGCHYILHDFSNAQKIDETGLSEVTDSAMFRENYRFAPPEILGGDSADARSDLFSLGAVIYNLFSGSPPFDGEKPIQVSQSHQTDSPPQHLSELRADIPSELANWAMNLLQIDPSLRPASASEALASFEEIAKDLSFSTPNEEEAQQVA